MATGLVTPNYTSTGAGVVDAIYCDDAPAVGVDAVQILEIGGTPDGGALRLVYDGYATADIAWTDNDSNFIDAMQDELDALANLGTDWVVAADVTLTSGIGTISLTFSGGDVTQRVVNLMTAENYLTGTDPTLEITEDTAGEDATGRDAAPNTTLVDVTNLKKYIQTGTAGAAPTWTLVGSQ